MLALFAADPLLLRRLPALLPAGLELRVAHEWKQLDRLHPEASCAVVCVEHLGTDNAVARLCRLKERHPTFRVILVTRWTLDNARCLKNLALEEIVWLRELDRELARAVRTACGRAGVRSLADELGSARRLPPRLRGGLVLGCRSEPPIRTVNALAIAAGCDRRTLWREWHGAPGDLRLEDVLHWLLLLRAGTLKDEDCSWADVAERLGVHAHTLGRMSRGLTGWTLRELERAGAAELTERFRREVLAPLLGTDVGQSGTG